jgi:dihydrofolate reductase
MNERKKCMRKLIVWMNSSANWIVSGPPSDKDTMVWADPDNIEDFSAMLSESMSTVDCILLGRTTYEIFIQQWPLVEDWPDVSDVVLRLGEQINTTPKVVVSGHSIDGLQWGRFEPPTLLTGPDVEKQIKALKERNGGDIMTFGSVTLVQSLANAGLVDEYDVTVYPVAMPDGRPLFEKLDSRIDLQLITAATSDHGGVLVKYAVGDSRAPYSEPME